MRDVLASLIPAEARIDRRRAARAGARGGRQSVPAGAAGALRRGARRQRQSRTRRSPTCCSTACRTRRMARGGSWRCSPSAARPMPPDVVYEAAGLAGDERPLVAILRSDHLLRHSGSASRIEMYHERLRETLAAQLSPDETRRIHGLPGANADGARHRTIRKRSSSTAGEPAIATARRGRRRGRRPRRTPCSRSTGRRSSIAAPSSWRRTRRPPPSGSTRWRRR